MLQVTNNFTSAENPFDFPLFYYVFVKFDIKRHQSAEMTFSFVVIDNTNPYEKHHKELLENDALLTAQFEINSAVRYNVNEKLTDDQAQVLKEHFSAQMMRYESLVMLDDYLESDDYLAEYKSDKFGINLFHSDLDELHLIDSNQVISV